MGDTKSGREKKGVNKQAQQIVAEIEMELAAEDGNEIDDDGSDDGAAAADGS